jgi:hypothetical protein
MEWFCEVSCADDLSGRQTTAVRIRDMKHLDSMPHVDRAKVRGLSQQLIETALLLLQCNKDQNPRAASIMKPLNLPPFLMSNVGKS